MKTTQTVNLSRYIAIDVDDQAFHGACLTREEKEIKHFVCRPTVGALIKKLRSIGVSPKACTICYESTYVGFSLQRELVQQGWSCEIIASALIPTLPGKPIKTDRLDCAKLV